MLISKAVGQFNLFKEKNTLLNDLLSLKSDLPSKFFDLEAEFGENDISISNINEDRIYSLSGEYQNYCVYLYTIYEANKLLPTSLKLYFSTLITIENYCTYSDYFYDMNDIVALNMIEVVLGIWGYICYGQLNYISALTKDFLYFGFASIHLKFKKSKYMNYLISLLKDLIPYLVNNKLKQEYSDMIVGIARFSVDFADQFYKNSLKKMKNHLKKSYSEFKNQFSRKSLIREYYESVFEMNTLLSGIGGKIYKFEAKK